MTKPAGWVELKHEAGKKEKGVREGHEVGAFERDCVSVPRLDND